MMRAGLPELGVCGPPDRRRSSTCGYAYFFPDGTPLAPAVIDGVNGAIFMHSNLSQFAGVLQMLREERPVYLYEFGPSDAGLMTGGEPTGEEEGSPAEPDGAWLTCLWRSQNIDPWLTLTVRRPSGETLLVTSTRRGGQ